MPSIVDLETQFAALDASIQRGIADAEQGRIQDIDTVRAALSERYATKGADGTTP